MICQARSVKLDSKSWKEQEGGACIFPGSGGTAIYLF